MNLTSKVETPVIEFIRTKYREYLEKVAVIDRDLKELSEIEIKMMDRLTSSDLSTQESEFLQKQLNDTREEAFCLFKVRKSLTQSYRLWLS